jgi:hypothetical protein
MILKAEKFKTGWLHLVRSFLLVETLSVEVQGNTGHHIVRQGVFT